MKKFRIIKNRFGVIYVQQKCWFWWSDIVNYISLGALPLTSLCKFDSVKQAERWIKHNQ